MQSDALAQPDPTADALLSEAQDELADVCASIAEFWGFTKTQGRVFGLLLMSPEPLDHSAIRARLEISAGSASMTLSTLLDWGVVQRDGRHYRAETDLWQLITHVLQRRESVHVDEAIGRVERLLTRLRASTVEDPRLTLVTARLTYIHEFFRLGRSLLQALISRAPVRGILGNLGTLARRIRAQAPQ